MSESTGTVMAVSDVRVMATGHREIRLPDLVAGRLDDVLVRLGTTEVISGGAEGADTLFAEAAIRLGIDLHLMLPNIHYRSHYRRAVSDDIVAAATTITYVVDRPNVVDWRHRWTQERWWVDNFTRNGAMVDASTHQVVISPRSPRQLLGETKGGTAGCVRDIRKRLGAEHRVIWVPDHSTTDPRWVPLKPVPSAA